MKKLLIICIAFASCKEHPFENDDETISKMKSPVILIGKNDKGTWQTPIATVRDADGKIFTTHETYLAISLMSNNIGDTIK